jgi:hypothetical protein
MLAAKEKMPEKIKVPMQLFSILNYGKMFFEYPASGLSAVAEHCLNIQRLRV